MPFQPTETTLPPHAWPGVMVQVVVNGFTGSVRGQEGGDGWGSRPLYLDDHQQARWWQGAAVAPRRTLRASLCRRRQVTVPDGMYGGSRLLLGAPAPQLLQPGAGAATATAAQPQAQQAQPTSMAGTVVPTAMMPGTVVPTAAPQPQQPAAAYAEAWGGGQQALPLGWEERLTADGRPYFVNHITKKSSWQRPAEEIQTVMQVRRRSGCWHVSAVAC
jgi:hypothetical protein